MKWEPWKKGNFLATEEMEKLGCESICKSIKL